MFKNLYYKIKRNLDQLNLEDIFEYAKNCLMVNIFTGISDIKY